MDHKPGERGHQAQVTIAKYKPGERSKAQVPIANHKPGERGDQAQVLVAKYKPGERSNAQGYHQKVTKPGERGYQAPGNHEVLKPGGRGSRTQVLTRVYKQGERRSIIHAQTANHQLRERSKTQQRSSLIVTESCCASCVHTFCASVHSLI